MRNENSERQWIKGTSETIQEAPRDVSESKDRRIGAGSGKPLLIQKTLALEFNSTSGDHADADGSL